MERLSKLLQPLFVWLWLMAWIHLSPSVGCLPAVVFLAPAMVLVALHMWEGALLRRRAFVAAYLRPGGWLSAWLLRPRWLMLWVALKAMILVALLMAVSARWPLRVQLLLLADLPLMVALQRLIQRWLASQARREVAAALARQWTARVNLALLAVLMGVQELLAVHPDYRGLGWRDSLAPAISQVKAGCDLLAVAERIQAIQETVRWRLMELGMDKLSNEYVVIMLWMLFLVGFSLALWGWSRLLAASLVDKKALAWMAGTDGDG